jgi:hypothetical protein
MPRILSCISTLAAIAAAPAAAQVSAEEVWAEWQAASAAAGQQMTADVSETADGLVLGNLTTRLDQDGTLSVGRVERVTLTETADGTLSVEVSNPYTLELTFEDGTDGNVTVELLVTHEALAIDVAGTPEARRYEYTADAVTISDGAISNDSGAPLPRIDMEIVARDLATTYDLTGPAGADQRFASEGEVGSVAGRVDILPPPGEPGRLKASFALGETTSEATGTIVALATLQQSAQGFPPGFEVEGTSAYAFARFDMTFDSPSDAFAASYANEGGAFAVALSERAMRYEISARGIDVSVEGQDLPVPVSVSAVSSELMLDLPLAAAPEPSEAAVRLAYRELSGGEALWSMIDPAGNIPRDPLTVILDATAQVQLLADLTDPATMERETPPAELRALTVSELEVSFGDTSLTGTADLSFAPGQAVPQPVGQAQLELAGGNALLERLQAAGVIGPEQAGMARGVAGMFTRPGAMPDTLETVIEFLPGGSITANGIPFR